MIRLIAVAGFALTVAVSAQAMTPASIVLQPDGMITKIAAACGAGRTRVVAATVIRRPTATRSTRSNTLRSGTRLREAA